MRAARVRTSNFPTEHKVKNEAEDEREKVMNETRTRCRRQSTC
jgi:hypothetical protein